MTINKLKNITIIILSICLILLSFIMYRSYNSKVIKEITVTDTIIKYQDPKTVIVKQPVPYFVVQTKIDTITKLLTDTILIKEYVTNYLTKQYYRDTLLDDSTALIVVDDIVYQNKLQNRTLFYKDRTPTQIITHKTYSLPNYRWYIGFSGTVTAGQETKYISLGPDLVVTTPNRSMFRGGYDFINKTINFGYAWNINYNLK